MKMKSLLFGSAAAMAVVTGARAADATVAAEAEPTEYVKVCDVYGAGYLYIPGTETCLRVGGHVRYEVSAGDVGSFDGARTHDVQDGSPQATWYKNTRFTLKTWTGEETAFGTLKTYTETRFNFGDHNAYAGPDSPQNYAFNSGLTLNFAWVQLGGLRVGKDHSAFDTFVGYAGDVINDTLVPYGDFNTNVVQYYFDAGQGLSGVVSLEEGQVKVGTIDSYVPHVVGGMKYKQGRGAITGVVAYDSNYAEVAGKVRVDFNVTKELSLFGMFGYGSDGKLNDDTTNTIPAHGRGFYKIWGGNWGFWVGGTYKLNEKTSFNLQVSGDELKNYGVAANVAYTTALDFTITAEVDYVHYGNFGLPTTNPSNVNFTNADKKNNVGGVLRFQRSF
ncbi:porin [Mesorhizobium sp. M2E.F.Ca.ET.209.01.1.1]|uniref:porin n=1 Tax=Mesorhizobium sp. M2E.F.Ca.ET.209.01.1.1 TaxID=2500526 RepID=UPI000FD7A991|nr:porin [Mesorhizobium sp. M2E.F.Ca.ET.209.01.1.1]TGS09656.1 porin [Mesorhizobium sp. M2E.F.Ca.ET.209.01.1.1]